VTSGITLWLVIFGVSVLLFFGVALIIAIHGVGDLRRLLRGERGNDETHSR
jgi:hypothetical protein